MPAPLVQVILLIANSGCTLLTVLLLMRFFMQWSQTPFDHPIGGFILHLTNWLVRPLRRIVPAIRGLDSASLLAAYLLQVALLTLVVSLTSVYELFALDTMSRIAIDGLRILVRKSIYLFIVLLIAQAVLSWFNPHAPLQRIVGRLTDPLLRPLRRIVPPISHIDVTPLIAILIAQILLLFV